MEQVSNPSTGETNPSVYTDADYLYTLGTIFLATTGFTLLVFSLAYAKDLETLRTVPNAIWSAICGVPTENGITLPLLMTMSTLSFMGVGVIQLWKRLKHNI